MAVERQAASPSGVSGTEAADGADPFQQEREAVEQAHGDAMQARIVSATAPVPDPDHPDLAGTHVDPYLSEWAQRLEGMATVGLAVRYPQDSELSVEYESVTFGWRTDEEGSTAAGSAGPDDVGDMATARACILDDGETFRVETGEVTAGGGLYTIYETAVLHKVDGVWKVAERTIHDDRAGVVGCAAT